MGYRYKLIFPNKSAFFDDVGKANHEESDKHHNGQKAIPTQGSEINRVGIKKDDFNVKQYKQDSDQEILHS